MRTSTVAAGIVLILVLSGCGAPAPAPVRTGSVLVTLPATSAPTPVITATVAPVPSASPQPGGAPDRPLEISAVIPVAPEEIAAEMLMFQGGGGGIPCMDPPQDGSTVQMRLPGTLLFVYCWSGHEADPSVQLTVTSPDRGTETARLAVGAIDASNGPIPYLDGFYPVDLSRSPGMYTFQLEGKTIRLKFAVEFLPARLPVVYEAFSPPYNHYAFLTGPRHRLHLAGFAPGEPLRLVAYQKDFLNQYTFLGWYPLAVGQDGQTWVDLNAPVAAEQKLAVSVVGAVSGEVHLIRPDDWGIGMVDTMGLFRATCPGAKPPRLKNGMYFRAAADLPTGQMDFTSEYAFTMIQGETIPRADASGQVIEGPFCSRGSWWWKLALKKNGLGVTAPESDGDRYLLEPAGQ